ncbi:MAG: putative DNA binding domain-containing protein [Deltaproteobacteria bacterium]|nr:putative DNA binding domain-containing protein [Deltaproteobacteria bacterium]MBW2075828.1 putative DNA binding domain-containing protein [Deltaproteobacteria bacterium]
MNLQELKKLVASGESDRLEFKRSTGQRSNAAKTICAMLNGLGGFVLFGVTNGGEILGQQISNRTIEDIARELRRIEPPAFPDIETITVKEDRAVIAVRVPGGGGPYTYDGRPYFRNGPTTAIMPRDEYERRLLERLHATRRWENEPVPDGVSIHDLDEEEIHITVENAIRLGRLEPPPRHDVESILRGLELIHDGKLLNAAVALYGKTYHLKILYPQLEIRLARFRGTSRLADFSDNRQYWGHAFALLRRAESFLLDHVPIAGRVVPGKMVREDRPLYPPRASREAVANAICHRDYTIPGGAVAVAMYDDHLEITNPGVFHFGITPEKLTQPHESKPWNPIIANVFYRAGIIERWGMGTLNIIEWCTENGNPVPEWSEHAGSVFVTFLPAAMEAAEKPTPQLTGEVSTKLALSRHQVEILYKCREDTALLDLMAITGRSDRTKFRHQVLNPLLEAGLIEMTIPNKPRSSKQKYRVTDKGEKYIEMTMKDKGS